MATDHSRELGGRRFDDGGSVSDGGRGCSHLCHQHRKRRRHRWSRRLGDDYETFSRGGGTWGQGQSGLLPIHLGRCGLDRAERRGVVVGAVVVFGILATSVSEMVTVTSEILAEMSASAMVRNCCVAAAGAFWRRC